MARRAPAPASSTGFASDNVEGIEVFLGFAQEALADPQALRSRMSGEADEDAVIMVLKEARAADEAAVAAHPDAPACFRWQGNLDGRQIVTVDFARGEWSRRHCFGDPSWAGPTEVAALPGTPGKCVVRYLDGSHRGWMYVSQQPSAENGHVLEIMMEDHGPRAVWARHRSALGACVMTRAGRVSARWR